MHTTAIGRTLTALFVCLGFVLHQVCVPLHLALHDHLAHDASGVHFDPPAGHHHGGGQHAPHPVADHADHPGERAVPPTQAPVLHPALAGGPVVRVFDAPGLRAARRAESGPPPPPTRSAGTARAPPFVA